MRITGTKSAELLTGTSGDDTLDGAGGADTIDGAAGFDTIDFSLAPYGGVTAMIDLAAGGASFNMSQLASELNIQTVKLLNIENVVGTDGGGRIAGNGESNVLEGRGGSDTLYGRDGNDRLDGGADNDLVFGGSGSDTLIGGEGVDHAWYGGEVVSIDLTERVVLDLSVGRAWLASGTDELSGIENVTGSDQTDWIKGDAARNVLAGGKGDDVIVGAGTTGDELIGGQGNDAVYGTTGNDTLRGDLGIDWLQAGAGDDLLEEYTNVSGEWSAMHGEAGNDTFSVLGAGNAGMWGGDGNDLLEMRGTGTVYACGGAGSDVYNVKAWDNVGGFVQVFDFAIGEDVVQGSFNGSQFISTSILGWGANTGVVFHDTITGTTETVMLMGVTSDQVQLGTDIVLV